MGERGFRQPVRQPTMLKCGRHSRVIEDDRPALEPVGKLRLLTFDLQDEAMLSLPMLDLLCQASSPSSSNLVGRRTLERASGLRSLLNVFRPQRLLVRCPCVLIGTICLPPSGGW